MGESGMGGIQPVRRKDASVARNLWNQSGRILRRSIPRLRLRGRPRWLWNLLHQDETQPRYTTDPPNVG